MVSSIQYFIDMPGIEEIHTWVNLLLGYDTSVKVLSNFFDVLIDLGHFSL
jgi:hypothetical protein